MDKLYAIINNKNHKGVNKMKFKKVLGCFILLLTTVLINSGNVSVAFVGIEEMPNSMKNIR